MELYEKALVMAARAHQNQFRKETNIPYITHPVAVARLLQNEGCDEDLIVAGLLHDVVEDTPITIEEISQEFNEHIATIVSGCTEPDYLITWKLRKSHTIDFIRNAPLDIKYVSCADKLHNVRTMSYGFKKAGDKFWKRFSKGFDEQKWYYCAMVSSLHENTHDNWPQHSIFSHFKNEVKSLFLC